MGGGLEDDEAVAVEVVLFLRGRDGAQVFEQVGLGSVYAQNPATLCKTPRNGLISGH